MYFIHQYFVFFGIVSSIWPPPYKVDLKQSEEFIIGDDIESNEDYFDAEDEIIKDVEIARFNLDNEKHKFNLLHKLAKGYNEQINENKYYINNTENVIDEQNDTYYDTREFAPHVAGFVDKNNNFILNQENKNVYYLNAITKQLVASEIKEKREEKQNNDYNYEELNKEYELEVKKELELKETFNSTNIEENESVKEAVHKMIDFKETPRNCTAEELKGIGFGAVKCVWIDMEKSKSKESRLELFTRVKRIIFIWFCIYASLAIPCWCHKGWCCCCCRCKACKPRERIDEAKKYYVESPPGIFLKEDGERIYYEPNIYEINAYMNLERTLMSL